MAKEQKESLDLRPGKRFATALSNENLRIGDDSAWKAKLAGTLDQTRTKLDFEVGRGGVVKEIDKTTSITKRIKAILTANGISDPNDGLSDEALTQKGTGVRTFASFILQGSHDTMVKLAFGNQKISFDPGADNSHLERKEDIEKWAKDMYNYIAQKYGEDNIAEFTVHLDETTPHAHCVVVPITPIGKLSFKEVFVGKDKYEFSKRTKTLWDEAAKIAEKYGMSRGDDSRLTGAKHKPYLQWMREQIFQNKATIEEQDSTIQQQSGTINSQNKTISAHKQQLYELNAEIAKANKKLKGLNTMISNLKQQKEMIEIDITALEDEYAEKGTVFQEEYEKKKAELENKLADIESKLSDKNQKMEDAIKQIQDLGKRKHQLKNSYDELQRQYNKDLSTLQERNIKNMEATAWQMAAQEAQDRYKQITDFERTLTPEQQNIYKHIYDNVFNGSIFEDMAQRGNEIVGVATALFLGYIDQATTFAQNSGGGGGPGSGWGRKDDEDEDAFRRRCFIMGRMMMRPVGRKLKRS